jgi:hypothetical protein
MVLCARSLPRPSPPVHLRNCTYRYLRPESTVYTIVRKDAALQQPDSFANRMVLSVPYTPAKSTAFEFDVFNVLFGADTEHVAKHVAQMAADRYEIDCWVAPAQLSYMRDLSDCMMMSLAVVVGEELAPEGGVQEVHFHRARRFKTSGSSPRAKR